MATEHTECTKCTEHVTEQRAAEYADNCTERRGRHRDAEASLIAK